MSHILVVEDDPHNALLFRKVLERRGGFTVTVTESAEEIVRLVRGHEVQLVILDVSLANTSWQGNPVNGIELCQLLKADPETRDVPVVLATAHAMRGDAEKFQRESGADDYVSKPILDHAAFIQQVKSLAREAA